jgi:hypothetical protein
MRAFAEQRDFKALLLDDTDVTAVLAPAEIEKAFDLTEQLKHVDHIFDRVFGATSGAEAETPATPAGSPRARLAPRESVR